MENVRVRSAAGDRFSRLLRPLPMARNLLENRALTYDLARRDVVGRYRKTWLGVLWSVITPLILLVIYTFVFAVVFQAKWGDTGHESKGMFALTMFCGMLVFNLFAEVANRSPILMIEHANYVKKVVFPLEVFVPAAVGTGLFNLVVGMGVWLTGWLLITQSAPPWTIFLLPVVLLPVILLTVGVGWILASLGVFIRDVGHAVVLVTQVLFFTTPIFYRIDRINNEMIRTALNLNPLSHAVEGARRVMMGQVYLDVIGEPDGSVFPAWGPWLATLVATAAFAVVGYAFFMKSKRAFSDVL
jgi:lipopolysaccharide transport system permease protein